MNAPLRRDSDETRSAILSTAWDLFRQLGARTTIADIADALSMSSANVYRYFPTKKALTDATCERVLGSAFEAIRAAADGQSRPIDRAAAMLRTMHVLMRDQMTSQARVHEIVDIAIQERWPAIDAYHANCGGLLAEIIGAGQATGEFGPGEPAALAMQTLAACASINHPVLIAQCSDKAPWPTPDEVVAFALRALCNRQVG